MYVQSTLTGSAALLTTQQAALLAASTSLRTLEAHADGNAARRAELESLVRVGLITSETALRQRCFDAERQVVTPPPISSIAVITRDRIESLRRCLASYIDDCQRAGRSVEYLVVDASPQAETRDLTRAMLYELSKGRDVAVRYSGLDERRRFADAMGAAGLPRAEIDFALFDPEGCDYLPGAARNAVLLATGGQLVLCADDDTVCRVAALPGSTGQELDLSSQTDPTAMWFFPNQDKAVTGVRYVDRDVLGIHEELLGRAVASCLEFASTPDVLRVDDMDGAMLRVIESGRAHVAVTSTGMHGDAGSGMPPAIRLLDPASRARLTQPDATYRTLALSRHVQRGVSVRTISSGPYLMTTGFAYDNRALMPPFFPVLRGEDNIYGFTLGLCREGACIGNLPFTLLHSPPQVRHVAPDAISQFAEHPTSSDLVIACIQSYSPPPFAGGERLRGLAGHLGEIASLAPADFEEFLRLWIWRIKALVMARLTKELEASDVATVSWSHDVEQYLERLRTSLAADGYLMSPDLTTRFGGDAPRAMQRLLARFAKLLECWTPMRDVARSLVANGLDLAPPLQVG